MNKQLTRQDSKLLFRALGANGIFSLICGVAMTATAAPLATWLGVPNHYWILGLGIMLIGFGASLLVHFIRKRVSRAEALAISGMDLAWVVGSVVLLLLAPDFLNRDGLVAVLAVGIVVAVFFELQAVALWQISRLQSHN